LELATRGFLSQEVELSDNKDQLIVSRQRDCARIKCYRYQNKRKIFQSINHIVLYCRIEEQLELATRGFLSQEVELSDNKDQLIVSRQGEYVTVREN
jgi:hypothetical protein